jgi:glutamyl-Q tRNA(Asp) synthetase
VEELHRLSIGGGDRQTGQASSLHLPPADDKSNPSPDAELFRRPGCAPVNADAGQVRPAGDGRPVPPSRGRFAPSPSGPLHFGSLVAALGSWLDARAQGGEWLLRIEDVDRPRTVAGAEATILRQLEACGLYWDGPVWRQSERTPAYREALATLQAAAHVYPCACSRSEIAARSERHGEDGAPVYPGTCRRGLPAGRAPRAWRLRVPDAEIAFDDRVQGRFAQNLERSVGDCVLWRGDGFAAYQLAVVVDDAAQGVTDVVRGADLFTATPRQIYLQRCLGLPVPRYAHLPVATDGRGEKLSKQTLAPAIAPANAADAVAAALRFLGQPVPVGRALPPVAELLAAALANWSPAAIPRRLAQPAGAGAYSASPRA